MSTALDTAIDMIAKLGALRTDALSAALGIGENAVDAMLEPARSDGRLISCNVEVGGRQVIEYRTSANGGHTTNTYRPNKPLRRSHAHLFIKRESTYGTDRAPSVGRDQILIHQGNTTWPPLPDRVAAPAPIDAAPKGEPHLSTNERIKAALEQHGPLTTRQLRAHVDNDNIAIYCAKLATSGELVRLGGGKRSGIYGLPTQTLDQHIAKAADTPAPTPEPSAPKGKKKRAGGGVRCNAA